jgi:hypothetical protein
MLQLEVPIHVLLVAFQAVKHCGHAVPTISEDVQETCLRRLTATMKFTEGVPPALVEQMITKSCVDHPERYLLAFVYGHLDQHDLLRVRNDAEKFLLLAALNLVECIAYVGAQWQSKWPAWGRSRWDDWTLTFMCCNWWGKQRICCPLFRPAEGLAYGQAHHA